MGNAVGKIRTRVVEAVLAEEPCAMMAHDLARLWKHYDRRRQGFLRTVDLARLFQDLYYTALHLLPRHSPVRTLFWEQFQGRNHRDIIHIHAKMDTNRDGRITFEEFCATFTPVLLRVLEEDLAWAAGASFVQDDQDQQQQQHLEAGMAHHLAPAEERPHIPPLALSLTTSRPTTTQPSPGAGTSPLAGAVDPQQHVRSHSESPRGSPRRPLSSPRSSFGSFSEVSPRLLNGSPAAELLEQQGGSARNSLPNRSRSNSLKRRVTFVSVTDFSGQIGATWKLAGASRQLASRFQKDIAVIEGLWVERQRFSKVLNHQMKATFKKWLGNELTERITELSEETEDRLLSLEDRCLVATQAARLCFTVEERDALLSQLQQCKQLLELEVTTLSGCKGAKEDSLMSRHRGAWLDLLTRHADAELEGIASGRRATMTKIAKMISQFREDNEAAFIEEWTAFLVQEDEDLLSWAQGREGQVLTYFRAHEELLESQLQECEQEMEGMVQEMCAKARSFLESQLSDVQAPVANLIRYAMDEGECESFRLLHRMKVSRMREELSRLHSRTLIEELKIVASLVQRAFGQRIRSNQRDLKRIRSELEDYFHLLVLRVGEEIRKMQGHLDNLRASLETLERKCQSEESLALDISFGGGVLPGVQSRIQESNLLHERARQVHLKLERKRRELRQIGVHARLPSDLSPEPSSNLLDLSPFASLIGHLSNEPQVSPRQRIVADMVDIASHEPSSMADSLATEEEGEDEDEDEEEEEEEEEGEQNSSHESCPISSLDPPSSPTTISASSSAQNAARDSPTTDAHHSVAVPESNLLPVKGVDLSVTPFSEGEAPT